MYGGNGALPRLRPSVTSSPAFSAVIPVHNEAGFIDRALPLVIAEMEGVGEQFEVLVVENGSTDDTASIVERLAADDDRIRVVRLPQADYGAAMRRGFDDATGEWVINFDIDYFSGAFITDGMARATEADLILASKRLEGADDRRSRVRRLGTWGFNLVLRLLFGSGVSDTHGMKMIRRVVVDELLPRVRSTKDLFDTELVIRAERAGYRIVEIPAVVEEMRTARSSFASRIPRTLRGMWRIRKDLRSER